MPRSCVDKVKKKALREELQKTLDRKLRRLGDDVPEGTKVQIAVMEVTEQAQRALKQQRRQKTLQFLAEREMLTGRMALFDGDPVRGALTAWAPDNRGEQLADSIGLRHEVLSAQSASLAPSLHKIREKLLRFGVGTQRQHNDDIISELARPGSSKNPDAAQIATEMKAVWRHDWERYKAAGAVAGTLEDYRGPQHWIDTRLAEHGQDAWRADLMRFFDREKMLDFETGAPLDEDQLEELANYAYDTITTRGMNKWTEPTTRPPGQTLSPAKKRDQSRVLRLTPEGEAFMRRKYGDEDVINAFVREQDSIARDTAVLQIMGPQPDRMHGVVRNSLKHRLTNAGEDTGVLNTLDRLHELAMGRRDAIGEGKWAQRIDAADKVARSFGTATALNAAVIPSTAGDTATSFLNSLVRGTGFANRMAEYLRFLRNSDEAFEQAIDDQVVTWSMISGDAGMSRIHGDSFSRAVHFSSRAASLVIEKQGLSLHTNAGRLAAINSHRRAVGKDLGKTWDQLGPRRRAQYENYGITPEIWNDTITKVTPGRVFRTEAKILDLGELQKAVDENTFRRVHGMVLSEGQKSVITTDIRGEALLEAVFLRGRPGTFGGLISNQLKMFKRFPANAAVLMREYALNPAIPGWTKAGALAAYAFSSLTLGAMALQTRQMIQGRDPLPMDTPTFWTSAFLYGGGLPFIGDVLPDLLGIDPTGAGRGHYSKSVWDLMPTVGVLKRMSKGLTEGFEQIFDGDVEAGARTLGGQFGADIAREVGALFGLKLWYWRVAIDRMIFEQWEQLVDPEGFQDKVDRQRSFLEGQGQDFFWIPGEALPERAPALQ